MIKQQVLVFAVTAITILDGCSWFAGAKPAVIPNELQPIPGNATTAVRWKRDVGVGSDELDMNLSPVLSSSTLYVADAKGKVTALDATTGNQLWQVDLDRPLVGGPGIGDGLVLLGSLDGELIALDRNSGTQHWISQLGAEIPSVPVAAHGVTAVHTNDGKLIGLSSASGEVLWIFHRSSPTLSLRGTSKPALKGEVLYAGLDDGRVVRLDLATGRPKWETSISYASGSTEIERVVDADTTPIVSGNTIYAATYQGDLAAVTADTGVIQWNYPSSSHQGLAFDGNRLYLVESNGHVVALAATSGEVLWTQKALYGRQLSGPAVVSTYLAVADFEGYVHWLSTQDGAIVARVKAVNSAVQSSLVVSGSNIIVYGAEGDLASVQAP